MVSKEESGKRYIPGLEYEEGVAHLFIAESSAFKPYKLYSFNEKGTGYECHPEILVIVKDFEELIEKLSKEEPTKEKIVLISEQITSKYEPKQFYEALKKINNKFSLLVREKELEAYENVFGLAIPLKDRNWEDLI